MIRKAGVGIVNYGSGNVASLKASLTKIGYRPHMLECPEDFESTKVVVIPGVGAFPQAMHNLNKSGLTQSITKAYKQGKRIVGICVGMQILAERGYEITPTEGLGLINGEIHPHPEGLQVGWMPLGSAAGSDPEMVGHSVYFNHSFHLTKAEDQVLYTCASAVNPHAAIVRQGSVIGIQFHPEKSQRKGLDILGRAIRGDIQ